MYQLNAQQWQTRSAHIKVNVMAVDGQKFGVLFFDSQCITAAAAAAAADDDDDDDDDDDNNDAFDLCLLQARLGPQNQTFVNFFLSPNQSHQRTDVRRRERILVKYSRSADDKMIDKLGNCYCKPSPLPGID